MTASKFSMNGERPPPGTIVTFDAHSGELLRVSTMKTARNERIARYVNLGLAVACAFALKIAPSVGWVWISAFWLGRIMDAPPDGVGWRFVVSTAMAVALGVAAYACTYEPLANPA